MLELEGGAVEQLVDREVDEDAVKDRPQCFRPRAVQVGIVLGVRVAEQGDGAQDRARQELEAQAHPAQHGECGEITVEPGVQGSAGVDARRLLDLRIAERRLQIGRAAEQVRPGELALQWQDQPDDVGIRAAVVDTEGRSRNPGQGRKAAQAQ